MIIINILRSILLVCRKKKRKSRWTDETSKTFIPGLPTMIPTGLSKDQEEAYLCKYSIFIFNLLFGDDPRARVGSLFIVHIMYNMNHFKI